MIDSAIVRLGRILISFLRNDRERSAVQYFAQPSPSKVLKEESAFSCSPLIISIKTSINQEQPTNKTHREAANNANWGRSLKTFASMEDIYSLPPREQAERLRALFKYLDQQYMDLVAFYHLLVPPWSLQTLIDRFNGTRRVSGFKLVRLALLDTCILAITKLLVDGDDANPSLLTMVRPFLQRNRQKRTELLQILEFDYSDWARRISPEERKTEPEWAIKMFEEEGERHAEACAKSFGNALNRSPRIGQN